MLIRDYYIMNDQAPHLGHPQLINPDEAHYWNNLGHGVFWTVNEFKGPSRARRISNLGSVLSWAIELDKGDKGHQLGLIESSPIWPSLVIESKRGFHIYYDALSASLNTYKEILERLIQFYDADPKCKDVTRLLRAPGYNHMKDPDDPFQVRVVWRLDSKYSEKMMLYAFRPIPEQEAELEPIYYKPSTVGIKSPTSIQHSDFWGKLYNVDCEAGLKRLSGKASVRFESFSFVPVSTGNLNILVNGKPTSCFIDKNKRIGSLDGGGPTLFQWLKWYGHSPQYIIETLKSEFGAELWI